MDQPSIDVFNVWLLSREISKTHKVAFTGAGGDEVFAGYPHHRIAKFLQRRRSHFSFDPVLAMVNNIPQSWVYSGFSIGRNQMAYVAASVLAGGNVRVGLEDNLWLEKGVLATNAQLVEKAADIVTQMGVALIGPAAVRPVLQS